MLTSSSSPLLPTARLSQTPAQCVEGAVADAPAAAQGTPGSDMEAGAYPELHRRCECPLDDLLEREAQYLSIQNGPHERQGWQNHGCQEDWQGEGHAPSQQTQPHV